MNAVKELRATMSLSAVQREAIRQAKATLAVEDMSFPDEYMPDLKDLVTGRISREEYQARIACV
ncbi:MAG: antitoxin VbhA family protein [Eubacterium sp.]|nr:antitoxin VbhA family protein [Eubacterium sp.]